jgi:hypothetical protein
MISWKTFPVRRAAGVARHFEAESPLDRTTFAIGGVAYEYGKYHRVVSHPVTEAERDDFPGNLKDANEQKLREREALDRQLREGWGQS